MLTSRGWRLSPAVVFCALLLVVTVFLLANPTADNSAVAPPVSKSTPTHTTARR
ncbi:MAG: hypothetical protein L0H96_14785 [Humibacillus sp.]|nr:hypothetical protein [Humibacillus sp.]MDN5778165.1 hypothetical protein [Humibacillus sp.]